MKWQVVLFALLVFYCTSGCTVRTVGETRVMYAYPPPPADYNVVYVPAPPPPPRVVVVERQVYRQTYVQPPPARQSRWHDRGQPPHHARHYIPARPAPSYTRIGHGPRVHVGASVHVVGHADTRRNKHDDRRGKKPRHHGR
ncbi:MAG: hypothetical protein RDU25_02205 [Patescibacteria group bacterium]|nr:hypothetical protein [Patescibacteria group bacterium]